MVTELLNLYGDRRLEDRASSIEDAMIASQTSSIHRMSRGSSFEKGAYRFFNNCKVTEQILQKALQEECRSNCSKKEVTVAIDTCTFGIESKYNRLKSRADLGVIFQNGRSVSYGFNTHTSLVYEHKHGTPVGISYVEILTPNTKPKWKKGEGWKSRELPIEEKESHKWIKACEESKPYLTKAAHVTFVADREADIIEFYDRIKDERHDVLSRCRFDRKIISDTGKNTRLYELLDEQQVLKTKEIEIINKEGKKALKKLGVKYVECTLRWPKKNILIKKSEDGVRVSVIQVQEISEESEDQKINWILISSKKIQNIDQAMEEVKRYEMRWLIEEFHKLLKTDGFNIEQNQMELGLRVRKLTLMAMKASIKVLKLKAARDGQTDDKVSEVFDTEEMECLEELNEELQGNTIKQMNPYEKNQLAWAAWIIARLGGWKEFYNSRRPPGNKTFVFGLERFDAVMLGYKLNKKYVS